MEISNHTIPSLHEKETELYTVEKLQSCKEMVATLLQEIDQRIKDRMNKLFWRILREELKNSHRRTIPKITLENNLCELLDLLTLINNVF